MSLGRPGTSVGPPGSPAGRPLDPDISGRITKKYAHSVKDAEVQRHAVFVPLDQRAQLLPDERTVARTVKSHLDTALKQSTGELAGGKGCWDTAVGQDKFQKELQFLCGHARTGQYIEQYGVDGHYDGEFLYGMRHGKGLHEFRGELYDGEWKWDQRHGWGQLTLSDGSQVKGEWQ